MSLRGEYSFKKATKQSRGVNLDVGKEKKVSCFSNPIAALDFVKTENDKVVKVFDEVISICFLENLF